MNWKLVAVLVAAGLTACTTASGWNNDDALGAGMIEIQMTPQGRATEIEFHVAPDEVPAAVRNAMNTLHPGGRFTGAEKETENGVLYYELTREVGGMEVEAMFTPEGMLHSEEIEVPASKVPAAVQQVARDAVAGGNVTKWEEIRDSKRDLVEYHVKMASGGKKWKVAITTGGSLIAVYREIPAEIEVKR